MKKLHILLLILIANFSLAQQNWELLPPHYNTPAEVKHVSHDGAIWAVKERAAQVIRSTDDASSWETTVFEEPLSGFLLTAGVVSDDNENTYCFVNNKIYSWDTAAKIWRTIHTIEDNIINMYISSNKLFVASNKYIETYHFPELRRIKRFHDDPERVKFVGKNPDEWVFISFYSNSMMICGFTQNADNIKMFPKPSTSLSFNTNNIVVTPDGTTHLLTRAKLFSKKKFSNDWEEKQLPEDEIFSELLEDGTGRIFYATLLNLYFSDDAGTTWNLVTEVPYEINSSKSDIHWILDSPGKLVAYNHECNYDAIYIKNEGISNWKTENINLDLPEKVLVNNTFSKGLVIKKCNSTFQFFDSEDNQWIDLGTDIGNFRELIILPSGKWLATVSENFYTSVDKGQNWIQLTNLPALSNVNIYITQNHDLFIGKQNGYFISKDEGLSWQEVEAPGFEFGVWTHMNFKQIFVYEEAVIYLGFSSLNKYSTIDQTTSDLIPGGDFLSVKNALGKQTSTGDLLIPYYIMDTNQSDRYWLYLLAINNTNFEFQRIQIGNNIQYIYPNQNGKLIGASFNELFVSHDYGQNWESIMHNLPTSTLDSLSTEQWIHGVNLSSDNYVYVSLADGSIYVNKEILNSTSVNTTELNTANHVSVYPNPATEYADFMITSTEELSQLSLHIFDLNGKIIHTANGLTNSQSYRWQTKGQTTGVYFYQLLQNGSSIQSGKVIIRQ